MENTELCGLICSRLKNAGIVRAVTSPGTRNAPLIQAMADAGIQLTPVVDERAAAFVALGMAAERGEAVAIVCTSGSAVLNYAPALAEALYRGVRLIALTADRPPEWIDRADSQTIRQPGALDCVVKRSVALPADNIRFAALLIDEALIAASRWPQGPVHINVPVLLGSVPRNDGSEPHHPARLIEPDMTMSNARSRELGRCLASPRRILIAAGGCAPSSKLSRAIGKLSALPNVAVVTEPASNLHAPLSVRSADATLAGCASPGQMDRLRPDLVMTLGGALVSAKLKSFLRSTPGLQHWHIGGLIRDESLPDTFDALTSVVNMPPETFMPLLASAMTPLRAQSSFADDWRVAARRGASRAEGLTARAPWCAPKAVAAILRAVPRRWNIHLSNGMTIRQAAIAAAFTGPWHRVDCNRGVSGIDGSTSTAVGAALTYSSAPTLLVTGDMSALYDIGILASGLVPPRMRIAVIDNSGGAIFRFAAAARSLPCRSGLLEMEGLKAPLKEMAEAAGMDFFEADSEESLRHAWTLFESSQRAALMRVVTDPSTDIEIYNTLINNKPD